MNTRCLVVLTSLVVQASVGQIHMSVGSYSQSFNSLASSNPGDTNWVNNVTLEGWYASQKTGGAVTNYRVSTGSSTSSALYSFGSTDAEDRALGSVAGGTPADFAYGVRFINDTPGAMVVTVTYAGEQWRRASADPHTLAFTYCISSSAITDADASGTSYSWTSFPSLDFVSPNTGTAGALDGNDPTNRQVFAGVPLSGVSIAPGEELFLRWHDPNDAGNDHGLAIDDVTVTFAPLPDGEVVTPIPLNIQFAGGSALLTWSNSLFGLQAAPAPDGSYTNVPAASSPYAHPINGPQLFFRLAYTNTP
jgi:hypothetical protein